MSPFPPMGLSPPAPTPQHSPPPLLSASIGYAHVHAYMSFGGSLSHGGPASGSLLKAIETNSRKT